MTDTETLFLDTLDDIKGRLDDKEPYKVLIISALIRKLFLDGGISLVDQVNAGYRLKIKFTISDPDSPYARVVKAAKPDFYSVQDGLDPETKLTKGKTLEVTRDLLLATEIMIVEGRSYSVRDVVIFVANIMGGVHKGSPKDENDKALFELNRQFTVGGGSAAVRQLKGIGRVVLKALEPLREAVLRV